MTDFIRDALLLIEHTLHPDVQVETDLPLHIYEVEADHTQMQMALTAVVANSNEAIEGSGRIQISARNLELDQEFVTDHPGLKPGLYVCIAIEDDGKGMDEEVRVSAIVDIPFITPQNARHSGMFLAGIQFFFLDFR